MDEADYITEEPDVPAAKPRPLRPRAVRLQQAPPPSRGKKGGRNPRDGRVKKGADDEPAQFESGSAAPPKNFDPEKIAEEAGLWWLNDGGEKFIIQIDEELWSIYTEKKTIKFLKNKFKFISTTARTDAGETLSEMDQLLLHVMRKRCVDGLMQGLAGYKSGPYSFPSGERIIIRKSPHPVEPKEGEWSLVKELIESRLNLKLDDEKNGIDQTEYWHCYVRSILRSLMFGKPGSWTQRMVLVLAGATNCGKSRLQKLITWLLGGREASPKKFLTGQDQFNRDLMMSEHAKMEELENVSKKMDDRLALSEALKAMVANEGVAARLMRTDPTTIYPFWVVTLSMNSDPDKMRPFPPLTPDFREKVLMFQVRQAPMPMETGTDEQKDAFNVAVRAQLPAYVYWLLNEFSPRKELLVGPNGKPARYGVRDFQHPSLAMELFDDTSQAELLMLVDVAEFVCSEKTEFTEMGQRFKLWQLTKPLNRYDVDEKNAKRAEKGLPPLHAVLWENSALELERLLLGDHPGWTCSVAREAKKLFIHNSCARLLARLKEDCPDRVQHKRTDLGRFWVIARPSTG